MSNHQTVIQSVKKIHIVSAFAVRFVLYLHVCWSVYKYGTHAALSVSPGQVCWFITQWTWVNSWYTSHKPNSKATYFSQIIAVFSKKSLDKSLLSTIKTQLLQVNPTIHQNNPFNSPFLRVISPYKPYTPMYCWLDKPHLWVGWNPPILMAAKRPGRGAR